MTLGITNAPQGGGSGGGDWVLHTDTDWSDVISYENNKFNVLKDLKFLVVGKAYNDPSMWMNIEVPAGTQFNTFKIPFTGNVMSSSGLMGHYFELWSSQITGSTVRLAQASYIISGSTVQLSSSVVQSAWNKSNIMLYYKP